MFRKSLYRLLIVTLLSGLLQLNAFAVEKVRNIVVFFSLNSNLPAYKNILEGLRSTIYNNSDESRNLIIEYFDIDRIENEVYAKHIINIYNDKFRSLKIDLLITVGPRLNPILQKYGLEALRTCPIIDIDLDHPGRISPVDFSNSNRAEILLRFSPDKTLKTAFALFPDCKNVYVVSGCSEIDRFFNSIIEKSKPNFEKDHVFRTITGISMDSTLKITREIPPESIVLVPNYFMDADKVPYTVGEVISFISANCRAPVLPVTDSFTERDGCIGGYVYSYIAVGREAGRIASGLLNGKLAKDISVNDNFYRHIYNWKALKKWHLLSSRAIPSDSLFLNEPFFSKNKYYLIGVILFLIFQSLLIFYLITLNKKQKKISEKMIETEEMHSELLRNDRMAKMTELTASLSHELNQPLAAILYSAQAGRNFLQKGKLDEAQATEIFENIIEDDKRAGNIISSVRNLMRAEDKEPEKIDIGNLIQETRDIFRSEAIRKGIKLDVERFPHPVYVLGDKIQLQQVLMNLIRNSFNAMEENGTKDKILEIVLKSDKGDVIISVCDTGPGIDPAIRAKLFKPFVTTRKAGSGIGLALSRSIIERHKGQIWVENTEGKGAVFSFRLEILKDENDNRYRFYHR